MPKLKRLTAKEVLTILASFGFITRQRRGAFQFKNARSDRATIFRNGAFLEHVLKCNKKGLRIYP